MTVNERLLRREVARFLPKDQRHEFEELYSDVVYGRCCNIMRTYDGSMGAKPITHLCVNVRWYAYKWVTARSRAHELIDLTDKKNHDIATYTQDHDGKLRVESVLRPLPCEVRRLLEWVHMRGFTPKEIATHLERPLGEVRRDIDFALELAQDYQGL